MAKVQTYYSEVEDDLRKNNLLFSQVGTVLDLWGLCQFDVTQGKPVVTVLTSKRIYERAQALGWQPPAQITDTVTTVHEAWQVMLERDKSYIPYSLWLLPIEAEKMLEWASMESRTVMNGKLVAKDLYYQACDQIRRVMVEYMYRMPRILSWALNKTLNEATVLISAHFDTFYYIHKDHDIKLLLLNNAWAQIKEEEGGLVSDRWLGSFLTDPIMPEFMEQNPDFTYDKLAELALKNQAEYEKTHQPKDESCRVHEKFANGFFGLGRSFG